MRNRPTLSQLGDGWYESEEPTRRGFVVELRRIRRRFAARPLPILLLAAVLGALLLHRVLHRPRTYVAQVILAMTEGTMSGQRTGVPAAELREYVSSFLLSDKNINEVVEKNELFPLRRTLGPEYGITELRSQLQIEIWRNTFVYYHEWDAHARKSVRIGITFIDSDPDRAFLVAKDLAHVAIATHEAERYRVTTAIANQIRTARDRLQAELRDLTTAIAMKQAAMARAQMHRRHELAAQLHVDLTALDSQVKAIEDKLATIAQSPEQVADEIAKAGLDLSFEIVEERRPDRPEHTAFSLVLVGIVLALGALLVTAVVVCAFDSRIHDTDDVERLGLPVLGHVPAFQGAHIGSLRARGVARPHGPSVMRWLSLQ
jgi:hypothetical protein